MRGTGPGRVAAGGEVWPWLIPGFGLLNLVVFGVAWLGGTVGAAITGNGWHPPPFTLGSYVKILTGATTELWPGAAPYAVYGGILLVLALAVALLVVAGRALHRALSRRTGGLAHRRDLRSMTPDGIAARARELRPSLTGIRQLHPDDTGNLLGDLDPSGPELRSSFEDVELDLMAPRAGKSTGIAIPRLLRARGPVLLTSNKSDVFTVTRRERMKMGRVWTFDPQGIAHTPREMWWDMLSGCDTIEGPAGWPVTSSARSTTTRPRRISGSRPRRTPSPPCSSPPRAAEPGCPSCSAGSPTRPTGPRSMCSAR
ncbi:hypothetical protein [Micromonospora zhanjiangensis]